MTTRRQGHQRLPLDPATADQHKKLVDSHIKIRTLLPVQNSLIGLELILVVMGWYFADQKLPVKHLVALLHCSQTGVRYHYRSLLEEGWIVTESCPLDARIRYITPTNKLIQAYRQLLNELQTDPAPP